MKMVALKCHLTSANQICDLMWCSSFKKMFPAISCHWFLKKRSQNFNLVAFSLSRKKLYFLKIMSYLCHMSSWLEKETGILSLGDSVSIFVTVFTGSNHDYRMHSYQQLPTVTNSYQQLPTGTNSYQQSPTVTNSYQQLPTVTNSHQQLPTKMIVH